MATSVCSSVCLSPGTRAAAGASADHTDHGCSRYLLSEKKTLLLCEIYTSGGGLSCSHKYDTTPIRLRHEATTTLRQGYDIELTC